MKQEFLVKSTRIFGSRLQPLFPAVVTKLNTIPLIFIISKTTSDLWCYMAEVYNHRENLDFQNLSKRDLNILIRAVERLIFLIALIARLIILIAR